MVDETTTIQVKTDLWAALDKRKGSDETFDDYIRRLVNSTHMPMGKLQNTESAPVPEIGDVEKIDEPPEDAGCADYDSIDGQCHNDVVVRQEWRLSEDDEWDYWYWCEEHAPDESAISD